MIPMPGSRSSATGSRRSHPLGWTGWMVSLVWLPILAYSDTSLAADDLWVARARAVRVAVQQVADSVLTVELVGVAEPVAGEVAADAPTVAVAIDDQGHFVASTLVTRGNPTSILLVTPGGRRVVAKPVAQDHARQLLLLRAEEAISGAEDEVRPLILWDGEPIVGQTVIAVGRHPGSPTPTVSTGILSGMDRNWGLALQTDARVSSAFYGGPLIDLYGRVLGIIVPMVPDGGAEDETSWYDSGIAFAIPAQSLSNRLPRLLAGEDVRRGLLGIVAKESDPYVEVTEIAAVRARSPASRADLQAGDQIRSIDGIGVRSHREIKQLLGGRDAGESVRLEILRDGESLDKQVDLVDTIPPLAPQRLGITVAQRLVVGDEATEPAEKEADAAQTWELTVSGLVAGLPADGQLQVGDQIQLLNGNPVDGLASLRSQVFAADPDQPLRISVQRGEEVAEVEVQTVAIRSVDSTALPDSLTYVPEDEEVWEVQDFAVPDLGNSAQLIGPRRVAGAPVPERDTRLGLMVLLADPGDVDLKKLAAPWLEAARTQGTIICLVAPTAEDRWTPDEIDVPQRLAAAIRQNHPIDPVRQVLGGAGKGPGGALALAVAILRPGTFHGLFVRGDVRPPGGVRLRENDPAAPLQLWLVPGDDGEPPRWSEALEKLGFPVLQGTAEPADVLAWTRSLTTI